MKNNKINYTLQMFILGLSKKEQQFYDASSNKFKQKIPSLGLLFLISFFSSSLLFGQYVHPNQAGRAGGDTGPAIGDQVVTSTYLGNAGNLVAQGTIMSVEKDGTLPAAFHEFLGFPTDGSFPFYTTPHQASDGQLYGTSFLGGANSLGAIYHYEFGGCNEDIIYDTPSPGGGSGNYANINELSDGKLYYVASYGGATATGQLISMNKDGTSPTVLHDFLAANTVTYSVGAMAQNPVLQYDGYYPYGFVVEGADGKIYGSTFGGGGLGIGAIYRCNKDGTNYEVIHSGDSGFKSYQDGSGNTITTTGMYTYWGNVSQGQDGRIYFVGYSGGSSGGGGLASIDPDGSNIKILVQGSAANGTNPYRGPIVVNDEVFGTFRLNGGGTSVGVVWRYNIPTDTYTKIKLFDATGSYEDGTDPWAGLSYDGTHLFGSTFTNGGAGNIGTIYKIKPDGTDFQTIHRLSSTAAATCNGVPVTGPGLYSYYPSAERVTFANVDYNCSLVCVDGLVDTDGDGVFDQDDTDPADPCVPAQSAGYTSYDANNATWAAADCDGDGETNGAEAAAGTDPYDPCDPDANALACPTGDYDGDGIANATDTAPSDPCLPAQSSGYTSYDASNAIWAAADCDGDGDTNGTEDAAGTDPYDPCDPDASDPACGGADADGDGIPDATDTAPNDPCLPAQSAGYTGYDATNATWAAADCDGDGDTNGTEDAAGTDAYDPCDPDANALACPTGDYDGDGVANASDSDPSDPCIPAQSAGYNGFDSSNPIWGAADCDMDGDTNAEEIAGGSDPYCNASTVSTPAGSCSCNAGSAAPILIQN